MHSCVHVFLVSKHESMKGRRRGGRECWHQYVLLQNIFFITECVVCFFFFFGGGVVLHCLLQEIQVGLPV